MYLYHSIFRIVTPLEVMSDLTVLWIRKDKMLEVRLAI